jgi:FtsZ-binding cell division protein ZapB
MSLPEILSIVAGVAGLVTGLGAFIKSRSESCKSDADAGHSVVDAAGDTVTLIKQVYESKISAMQNDIAELKAQLETMQRERESDRRMIIDLNRQVGVLRQAGEMAGKQIQLLLSRIDELLSLLKNHGIQLPEWAQPT